MNKLCHCGEPMKSNTGGDYCPRCSRLHPSEYRDEISIDAKADGHPQADLLEKLAMIKEAIERNPEKWWRELERVSKINGQGHVFLSPGNIYTALSEGYEIRLKPQRVKVEGEVDAEVITWAQEIAATGRYNCPEHRAATALLKLVKEEG